MPRVSHRQLRRLMDCLGRLYPLRDRNDFPRHVLQVGREAVDADFAVYDEIHLAEGYHRWVSDPAGLDLSAPTDAHASFFAEHPFVQQVQRRGAVPPVRLSDFLSRRQYHRTGFYNGAYRRFGVEYQLGFTLPPPSPACTIGLAFNRRQRDFSEEERLTFALLRPHVVQAWHNTALMTRLQEANRAAVAGPGAPPAIVTLDPHGRIRSCPPAARQWLGAYFGQRGSMGSELPDSVRAWLNERRLPRTCADDWLPPAEPLVVAGREGQMTIRLLADSGTGTTLALEERTPGSADRLQQLGLTRRQSEVLLWIAHGKTNRDIATIVGLRPGTVHKHTEHIFTKLGVETRTAAAARAWEIMVGRAPF
jgi:DNA-binding CsgD family transcriptional regulator